MGWLANREKLGKKGLLHLILSNPDVLHALKL